MLKQLTIQNFALIDHLEVDLEQGLSVITGETGAGKSILLGALSLILGNRADHSSLQDRSKKCIVEGVFDITAYQMEKVFDHFDLDYAPQTILRREISPQGKSRNFVNDTPTTLEAMKRLGEQLIDIHSQHQSLLLNKASFQLDVLDALAGNNELLQNYRKAYATFRKEEEMLSALKEKATEAKKQEDYLNFQFTELEALALKEGENAALEQEQERFANSEEISRSLLHAQLLLGEAEGNVLEQLAVVQHSMETISRFTKGVEELSQRLKSTVIELQDIVQDLEQQKEHFEYDPERHQWVEERLGEIHRLQRKHQLQEADDLLALQQSIESQLLDISNYDQQIERHEKELKKQEEELKKLAEELSSKRNKVIPSLVKKVEHTLKNLGMLHAKLKIEASHIEMGTRGSDAFQFLFSANKGIAPEQVSKTASGGEVSRLMLAIKGVLAEFRQLPTILFDEIDTGVSGEVAEQMGNILAEIGKQRQVIAITHLPQLAAKGKVHYYIFKEEQKNTTQSRLKQLTQEERVVELAKMLSGKNMTEAALNNARELLAQ